MSKQVSPIGKSVADDIKESLEDPEFRTEYERLAPYEELARIVIMRRAALGLKDQPPGQDRFADLGGDGS